MVIFGEPATTVSIRNEKENEEEAPDASNEEAVDDGRENQPMTEIYLG